MSVLAELTQKMGQLLGPEPLVEIVITLYEGNQLNYQIEGMKGPVEPRVAYQLLATVAQTQLTQEAPSHE